MVGGILVVGGGCVIIPATSIRRRWYFGRALGFDSCIEILGRAELEMLRRFGLLRCTILLVSELGTVGMRLPAKCR